MILYLSGTVRAELPALGHGYLLTPMMGNRPDLTGVPWGADTGCFADPAAYSLVEYLAFLAWCGPWRAGCVFATAPDVVGDAGATLERSAPVLPLLRKAGYPAALVAQDGLEALPVPWRTFDALFVGGSTRWKLSEAAYGLARQAKERGKWTHLGRVNSHRRLRQAAAAGYDSADGTYLKYGPDVNLPRLSGWLEAVRRQPPLPLWVAG